MGGRGGGKGDGGGREQLLEGSGDAFIMLFEVMPGIAVVARVSFGARAGGGATAASWLKLMTDPGARGK